MAQIRKRDVVLKIMDSNGKPFAGPVEVDQIRNGFPFGGSSNAGILTDNAYQQVGGWVPVSFLHCCPLSCGF